MKPNFCLDLDFFNDQKVQRILKEHGNMGVMIIIRLLAKIYANGYYITWDLNDSKIFSEESDINFNLINDTIIYSANCKFFDKNLLDKYNVLTSKGIQKRYVEKNISDCNSISLNNKIALIRNNSFYVYYTDDNDIVEVNKSFINECNELKSNIIEVNLIDINKEDEETTKIRNLWIRTFKRNPPDQNFIDRTRILLSENDYNSVYRVFMEGYEKNFRNFFNFFNSIEKKENGELKIRDRYGNNRNVNGTNQTDYSKRANYEFDPNEFK